MMMSPVECPGNLLAFSVELFFLHCNQHKFCGVERSFQEFPFEGAETNVAIKSYQSVDSLSANCRLKMSHDNSQCSIRLILNKARLIYANINLSDMQNFRPRWTLLLRPKKKFHVKAQNGKIFATEFQGSMSQRLIHLCSFSTTYNKFKWLQQYRI